MAKIRGSPVRPRSNDARKYRKILRELVDVPVLRGVAAGLEVGTETLASLQYAQTLSFENVRKKLKADARDRLDDFFDELSGSHEKRFVQAHRKALGVSALQALLSDKVVREAMEQAMRVNVDLIKLVAKKHLPKVFKQVAELYGSKPFDREALAGLFAKEWGYRDYPLRRIARDQVNKAVGSLNQIRQKQIGVSRYEWATAGDNRVRERHAAHNGLTFAWDNPPVDTGHPGNEIQCRCVALAVLDDLVKQADPDPVGAGIPAEQLDKGPLPRSFPIRANNLTDDEMATAYRRRFSENDGSDKFGDPLLNDLAGSQELRLVDDAVLDEIDGPMFYRGSSTKYANKFREGKFKSLMVLAMGGMPRLIYMRRMGMLKSLLLPLLLEGRKK